MKDKLKVFVSLLVLIGLTCPSFAQKSAVHGFGVSILDYGAKPAKEWSKATDNSAAIQSAIDANPGRLIFIPAGLYLLKKEINITHDVRLVGETKYSTILQPVGNNGIIINSGGVTLENFFIYGWGKTGIIVNGVRNTTITNILLQNVEYGIQLINAWNTKISGVDIDINAKQSPKVLKGIIISGQSVNNYISDSQITAVEVGVFIEKSVKRSEGLMLSNVVIYGGKTGLKSEGILSLHLNNCIIDLAEEYAIETANTAGLLVSNSWIYSQGKKSTNAVKLSTTWDSHFSASNIKCEDGSAVILFAAYSNNNIISNCTLELVNSNRESISLEKTTTLNLIKNNNFKMPKTIISTIIDRGIKNRIMENINTVVK